MMSYRKQQCRIRLISTERELQNIRQQWTELHAEVLDASIFLTWDWVSLWWRYFEQHSNLWVLTAWDDAGLLIGIAPFKLITTGVMYAQIRKITFITERPPVHQNIVAKPQLSDIVCSAFIQYLLQHQEDWDVLDLKGLVKESVMKPKFALLKGYCYERLPIPSVRITLPDDWYTYQQTCLSRNKRKRLRRLNRKLERDFPGQIAFHCVTDVKKLKEAIAALSTLNRKRFRSKGGSSVFEDQNFIDFCTEVATTFLLHGWLRIYVLIVANQIIAVEYCFHYRNCLYAYLSGFDPDWHQYSPGHLLQAHSLREGIDRGANMYDMLRGRENYKFSWANQECTYSHITMSETWLGHAWLLSGIFLDQSTIFARSILPQSVRERINGNRSLRFIQSFHMKERHGISK